MPMRVLGLEEEASRERHMRWWCFASAFGAWHECGAIPPNEREFTPSSACPRERRKLVRKQREWLESLRHRPWTTRPILSRSERHVLFWPVRTLHQPRTNNPTSGTHPVLQTSYSYMYDGCGVPVDRSTATEPIGTVGARLGWLGDGTVAATVVPQRMSQLNS